MAKKKDFCEFISILGLYAVLLSPVAILILFFVSLFVGQTCSR
jgi:hypothetical protein